MLMSQTCKWGKVGEVSKVTEGCAVLELDGACWSQWLDMCSGQQLQRLGSSIRNATNTTRDTWNCVTKVVIRVPRLLLLKHSLMQHIRKHIKNTYPGCCFSPEKDFTSSGLEILRSTRLIAKLDEHNAQTQGFGSLIFSRLKLDKVAD